MNPYLESRWGDVHTGLCTAIRASLQPRLPAGLRARAEERILLSDDEPFRVRRGDPVLIESSEGPRPGTSNGGVATAEPVVIEVAQDVRVHRWIKIVDTRDGNRVVTVIEVLSPSNKEP